MKSIPIVILCGGNGIWIDSSGQKKVKALVSIGGEPLLYWLLISYVSSGFRRFILSTGYQTDQIHNLLVSKYSAQPIQQIGSLETQFETISYRVMLHGVECTIDVSNTGLNASTGDRIKKVETLLNHATTFGVTYSDTLCSISIEDLLQFHIDTKKIGTLVGAFAPTRFRVLGLTPADSLVRGFASKPIIQANRVNGGVYFFEREILRSDYLGSGSPVILEKVVLEKLVSQSELAAYLFDGNWFYLDCERDIQHLEFLVKTDRLFQSAN